MYRPVQKYWHFFQVLIFDLDRYYMWENHHILSAGVELDNGVEINIFEPFVALQ